MATKKKKAEAVPQDVRDFLFGTEGTLKSDRSYQPKTRTRVKGPDDRTYRATNKRNTYVYEGNGKEYVQNKGGNMYPKVKTGSKVRDTIHNSPKHDKSKCPVCT